MIATDGQGRKAWQQMQVSYVGHVGDVLQMGGGKFSPSPADPGEPRKTPAGPEG